MIQIGISGKRKIDSSQKKHLVNAIEQKIRQILKEKNGDSFIGYTSLAIGADLIFAEVVATIFKMPLHIVLPMPLAEYEKDFSQEDALTMRSFLEKAKNIEIITSLSIDQIDRRNDLYFRAGKQIVDICDEVIFVWDEQKPNGQGGTAEIMGYYSDKKKLVPVDYILVNPIGEDSLDVKLDREFTMSNHIAIMNRDSFKQIWGYAILLGLLAALVFGINTSFNSSHNVIMNLICACLEFTFVAIAFVLIGKAKTKNYHEHYLKQRLRAESLRVLRCFYHANIAVKVIESSSQKELDLSKIVHDSNCRIQETKYSSKYYANYVIKTLLAEQISYHTNRDNSIGNKFHLWEKLNWIIAALFIINLLMHFADSLVMYYMNHHLLYFSHKFSTFAAITLPACYAAVEGLLYYQGWGLLKKHSLSAKHSLNETLTVMPSGLENISESECYEKHTMALNLIASIMLTDNKNWNLIFEDKNNYHWVI